MTRILLLFIAVLPFISFAQEGPSAYEILDKSIEFCGGLENLKKIKSSEKEYMIIAPDSTFVSLVIKKEQGKSFCQSMLSWKHESQTTLYNGKSLTEVRGNDVFNVKKLKKIQEIKLKTYDWIQLGYKQLNFVLTKLPDQKFNEKFDCFVIKAEGNNGYTTLNYFNKTDYRLIMIMYPNQSKSLLMEYEFKNNVLHHTTILNVDTNMVKTTWRLQEVNYNRAIPRLWFNPSFQDKIELPNYIKQGTFFANGNESILTRKASIQTEKPKDSEVEEYKLFLHWYEENSYVMMADKTPGQGNLNKGDGIFVKIVSWDKKGYVCHWIANTTGGTKSGTLSGTEDYKIIK